MQTRRTMRAVRPVIERGATKALERISPPPTGWKLGPVTIGTTPVTVEPVRLKRRRAVIAFAAGSALAFLFDPTMGRTRRTALASKAVGLAGRVKHMREASPDQVGDPALQQKIKSDVLGSDRLGISVDVASGVVTLRGTCEASSDIRALERAVRKTEGVRDVINLLHAPGTPAPNVRDGLHAT